MEENPKSVERAREHLREKLFTTNQCKIPGNDREFFNKSAPSDIKSAYSTVKELLERTILGGEGNSLLVIGGRGVGKTWVLNEVLHSLNSDPRCADNYLLVKLDGLVHTDDHLALIEVAYQLDPNIEEEKTMSFSSALEYVVDGLRTGSRTRQSVVFILDEFDRFTVHRNQILLYNLFDLAQSYPIAVIGVSCRVDVDEKLEKRVRSRFSNQKIDICGCSFKEYLGIFQDLLSLPTNFEDKKYLKKWTHHVQEFCQRVEVTTILKEVYNTFSGNIHYLKTVMTLPVSRLGQCCAFLRLKDLIQSWDLLTKDYLVETLKGLSTFDLCLVIAASKFVELNEEEPFNFEMVYSEYKKFTLRSRSVRLFSKQVAMKAFEHLIQLGIISPLSGEVGGGNGGMRTMKEYRLCVLSVQSVQVRDAVKSYPNCPTDVSRWGLGVSMA